MIVRAVPVRRAEFAAGRLCARAALSALGVDTAFLRSSSHRTPEWPHGATGSISHTRAWAGAVVASEQDYRSVGLDLEPHEPIEPSLFGLVTTPAEREWLSRSDAAGLFGRLLFCVKEASYKCQFPLTHAVLEFTDLEVDLADLSIDPREPSRCVARFTRAVPPFDQGEEIECAYHVALDHFVVVAAMPVSRHVSVRA